MRPRILLPLLTYPDVSPAAALPRALDLAATLNGEVTALIHEVDIPPITEPFANLVLDVTAMSSAAEALSRSRSAELAQAVKHQSERIALPLAVETFRGVRLSGDFFAGRARTCDLTILPSFAESPDHDLLAEEVLFRSGGPAVVMPAEGGAGHTDVVAVAWDGGRAAARALRDALGVLKDVGRFVLLTANEDKAIQSRSVAEVLAFLKAHEVAAEHRPAAAAGNAIIGDVLQQAALDAGARMLVMGAYGHSRMREFILGGATKSVLRSPRLPILMSH
jgi:nucleotide-binding universal stress UspA family protein